MHCNLRSPDATPVLIRFTYDAMPSLKSLNLSAAILWRFCCWYIILRRDLDLWPCDLDLWPLTFDLEHLQCIACGVMNLCSKFERNGTIRSGVIAISVFDLMIWTLCSCCDNFHQVWPLTTYPFLNYSVFLRLIPYVTLWPSPLTRWSWKFLVHHASRDQSLYKVWAKSINPWLNYW